MTGKIAKIIEQRTGHQDLIELLADRLSGADLNSLLLEVFARRAEKLTAPALLKQYERNRFVQPADTDYIHLLEKSVQTLKCLSGHGFVPRQMSPLSQLGTCSVIATVSQSKVVSALRNCEVLSDASNALALYISSLKKEHPQSGHLKYCTVQRHVRAQQFNIKGFEPHFTIGCMVSSGMDTGSYTFEKQAIGEHFTALYDLLGTVFKAERIWFKLQPRDNSDLIPHISDYLRIHYKHLEVKTDANSKENNYYKGLQYKMMVTIKESEIEIADGGFTDWTQQLLNNKKERFFISGFGLELLNRFEEGLL